MEIKNCEGLTFLSNVESNSIDLILTDPPYIISKDTGMNAHYNNIKKKEGKQGKKEEEWENYKEGKK